MANTAFTLSAITQTALISVYECVLPHVYIAVIKASCHEMLRMALNRHELACYRRQRKWGLLTQLVLIIACSASFKPCRHASFMRAVMVQYGSVQHVFRFN